MKLARPFFEQKTLTVARELLGCFLIRRLGRGMMRAQIIETEAYGG
ncbi:MAG TPA: DNA-3-methyladenine glycosylase, partial [Candidatus Komeilibacteria bacterium]|nr:DNA-3-methyladenine glycosylase [Candidatus Komeilibacteria bacterium]